MSHPQPHTEPSEHHDTAIDAARPAPIAPEADASEHASRPAPQKPEGLEANLVPQEVPPVVKPPIQSVLPPTANDTATREVGTLQPISEELRVKAEEKLAKYIEMKTEGDHAQIAAGFTPDLKLTLKENINGQHDGLELCFQGPLLTTNSGLFGEQMIAALKEHPSFAPLFHDAKTSPHFMKPHEAGKEDMLHVHINHLTGKQFNALVHSIADSVNMPKPQHEQVMEKAAGTAISAQKKETANDHPAPTIQAPVAALDKVVANDNEIAAQGVAR